MAKRTQWIPHFTTSNATLDGQHQQMLAQCNELADCLAEGGNPQENAFSRILDSLMANVRAHFAVEQTLLSQSGYPLLDAHTHEGEEFEFLAAEIIRSEHFDPEELQTFLALWCTGHIVGTAPQQRPYLEPQTAATS